MDGLGGSRVLPGRPAVMPPPSPPVAFPFFADLRQPALLLNNTVSLRLDTEPGVSVGIW